MPKPTINRKKQRIESKKVKPPIFQTRVEDPEAFPTCDSCHRPLEGMRNLCDCMKDIQFAPRSDSDVDM